MVILGVMCALHKLSQQLHPSRKRVFAAYSIWTFFGIVAQTLRAIFSLFGEGNFRMSQDAAPRATLRDHIVAAAVVSLVAKIFWLPGAAIGFVISEFYPDLPYDLLPFGSIVGPMVTGAVIATVVPLRFLIQTYKRAVAVEVERRESPAGQTAI